MSLQVLEAQTGENPVATVLILHGLGADGRDFLPVAEQLDLSSLGPVRFIFPNAPVMPVTINGGYMMPAWYDVLSADLVKREDEAGLRQSRVEIEALIANEKARGIPASRIVVAGFSQGAAAALMTLRDDAKLAGVVALSGYLPLAGDGAASPANGATPVLMCHGDADAVVAYRFGTASRDAVVAAGLPVEFKAYAGMGHSACPEELRDVGDFLEARLPPLK